MLVVIAHGDPRSGLDPPPARAELAEQRLEQTGLPRAIRSDDRHPLPGGHRKARDREPPARAFPRWPGVHELETIALKDQLRSEERRVGKERSLLSRTCSTKQ